MSEIKTNENRVDRSANGTFLAFWRGRVVYEKVESSGSKLKKRLGNFSATAIWQATSYIKSLMLLFGVVTIDGLLLFPSDGWEPHLH